MNHPFCSGKSLMLMGYLALMIVMGSFVDSSALGRRQLACAQPGKIVDENGNTVILRGLGLGGWLLPEAYEWTFNADATKGAVHYYDRPRRFEQGILDLLGGDTASALAFWKAYHDNFVTEMEVAKMKAWGCNHLRVAINANVLQPRDGQPANPPYVYDPEGWRILDNFVAWCTKWKVWIIWDMHGAPGGQAGQNIDDSNGQPLLWNQPATYGPRTIDLWMQIVRRYADNDWVVGYNLLNEPRLDANGISRTVYYNFCKQLTDSIRKVDTKGLLFIDGDNYAQNFTSLTPPWDPQVVYSFHCYPPVNWGVAWMGLDTIQAKYKTPLWHGETGEQAPPYSGNTSAVTALEGVNPPIGWCWWTHKKFNNNTQPWNILMKPGFTTLVNWLKSQGNAYNPSTPNKPTVANAKLWLMQQAAALVSDSCTFLPDMVRSLKLNPDAIVPVSEGIRRTPEANIVKLRHEVNNDGSVTVLFSPQATTSKIRIYTMAGKKLMDANAAAGAAKIVWNGKRAGNGVYLYTLTVGSKEISNQMVLTK
jgi:hypothetical protein